MLFINTMAWAEPSSTATLAPESRLRPFFKANGLGFQDIAAVTYAAGKLRDLIASENIRDSHIAKLNKLFPGGAIKIDRDIRQGSLKSGKIYNYAVFRFEKERKAIHTLFIKDHDRLTDEDLSELGIEKDEAHHLDRPGLEGVWFLNPTGAPREILQADRINKIIDFTKFLCRSGALAAPAAVEHDFDVVRRLPHMQSEELGATWDEWARSGGYKYVMPAIRFESIVQVDKDEAYIPCSTDNLNIVLRVIRKDGSMKVSAAAPEIMGELKHKAFYYKFTERLRAMKNGEDLCVAFGDIDHLHKVNQVFGKLLTNRLLRDISLDIMSPALKESDGWYFQFGGDEMCIIAPLGTGKDEVFAKLDDLRRKVYLNLRRRYGIVALNILEIKESVDPAAFDRILAIAKQSLIFEESKHRGKCLGLFVYPRKGVPLDTAAAETIDNINKEIERAGIRKKDGSMARLGGMVEKTFNHGYMWGPTISGGILSINEMYAVYSGENNIAKPVWKLSEEETRLFYEAVIERTEAVLGEAKKERNRFMLDPGGDLGGHKHDSDDYTKEFVLATGVERSLSNIAPDPSIPTGSRDFRDPRYRKDPDFRSEIYKSIGSGKKGALVEIECVYGGKIIEDGKAKLGDKDLRELRGDSRGVGLRAINTIIGHNSGDLVIRLIANELIAAMPQSWRGNPGSPRGPPMGRMVDRCSIYLEGKTTAEVMEDIESYIYKAQESINGKLNCLDVKIKASIADSEGITSGGLLSARVDHVSQVTANNFTDDFERNEVIIPLEKGNLIHRYTPAIDNFIPAIQEKKAYVAEKTLELNWPEGAHLKVRRAAVFSGDTYDDFGEIVDFTGISDDDTVTIEFQIAGRKIYRISELKKDESGISLLGRGGIMLKPRDQVRWLELSRRVSRDSYLLSLGRSNLKDIYHDIPMTEFTPEGDPEKIGRAVKILKAGFLSKIRPGDKIAIFFHNDADGMSAAKLLELFLREYTSEREALSLKGHVAAPTVEYYNVPSSADPRIAEKKAAGYRTVVLDLNLQKNSSAIDLVIDHHMVTDELSGDKEILRNNPGIVIITPRILGMGDFYTVGHNKLCRMSTTGNIMRPVIKRFFEEYKAALFDSRYGWLAAISFISEGLEPEWRKYPVLYNVCKMLNRVGGLSEEDALLGLETINSFITEDPSHIEKLYARFSEVMDLITPMVRRIYADTEDDPYIIYFMRQGEISAPQKLGNLRPAHAILFELIDIEREWERKRPIFVVEEDNTGGRRRLLPFCQQPYGADESGEGRPDLGKIMGIFGGGGIWHSAGVRDGVDIAPGQTADEAFTSMKAKIEAALRNPDVDMTGVFDRDTVENINNYFSGKTDKDRNFGTENFARIWDSIFIGPSNEMFEKRLGAALDADEPAVLDLGTGTGKALLPIASRIKNGTLVGIDMNEAMIEYARKKFAETFPGLRVSFMSGNVHELDKLLPEGELFDGVTARLLVNFIDTNKVFPQAYNRLRPGGRFVFNIFAGNFYGDNEELARSNPFYVALKESFRKVLEEEIPKLPPEKIQLLIDGKQVEKLPDGTYRIIGDAVTQHKGLDRASLERTLRSAGFEDIVFEPVPEMYPALEKRRSSLLTKSIAFFWGVTNVVFTDDIGKRIDIINRAYDGLPKGLRSGDILTTDVFISCTKPKTESPDPLARANTGTLQSYLPKSPPRGIDISKDTAYQLLNSLGRDASSQPLDINWIGIRPVSAGTCPLKCMYCDQSKIEPGMAVSFDGWKDLVRTVTLNGERRGVYLDISGGEPALWGKGAAHLVDFIRYAKSLGMIVVLSSNGALIDDALAGELAASGLDNISISLDSHEKSIHDAGRPFSAGWKKIVGETASSFEHALKAMRLIDSARKAQGSGLTITVNTVITNRNYRDFVKFIGFVGQNTPANDINICPVKDDRHSDLFLSLGQIEEWEQDVIPNVEKSSAQYGFNVIPKKAKEIFGNTDEERLAASRGAYFIRSGEGHSCFTALTSLYVDYNGRVFACSYGADHVDDKAVHLGVMRDFSYDITRLRRDPEALAKINSVPGMSAAGHETCNKYCGRDVARTNNNVRMEFAKLVNAAYAGLSDRMTPELLELSRKNNTPLYRIASELESAQAPEAVSAVESRGITDEALDRADAFAEEYGLDADQVKEFIALLPVKMAPEIKDNFMDNKDAMDLIRATLIFSRMTGLSPVAVFDAAHEFLKKDTGLVYAPLEMYLWAYRFYAQEISKRASVSVAGVRAEADRTHKENMKTEYIPAIPDKTILCHIITDSIVPVQQQNMLKVALEQNMEKEAAKGTDYKESIASLSGANAGNPDEYINDLRNLMQKKRDDYRALGYADVRFDVACPDTGLVNAVLGSGLGVKALAFEPRRGADFNFSQVEGIMLALRALDSGDITKLKSAFAFLSGIGLSPGQLAITDIDTFIRTVSFILPAAKVEDYNERRRLNDLITANIKQAA